ncbi:hypothetical protein [Bailinhaonella thermotolerans]|uniref:Uncharacterized protein n=1 Tax=Bailinhaonella thermotolerans TaxID=1070861 RepID=A0A3A4APA4_9ACTN|nr:hypothetical protein [Bailinhaonella thermotolerans]RJL21095.1 hypothetical protein D5H75_38440 [Bailinhaonella thermotolerans]
MEPPSPSAWGPAALTLGLVAAYALPDVELARQLDVGMAQHPQALHLATAMIPVVAVNCLSPQVWTCEGVNREQVRAAMAPLLAQVLDPAQELAALEALDAYGRGDMEAATRLAADTRVYLHVAAAALAHAGNATTRPGQNFGPTMRAMAEYTATQSDTPAR